MGADETKRVQFRAPSGLVARADALAAVLETNRTDVITDALREYLRDAAHDDALVQEIAGAYYDDEIDADQLEALLGHEEAANVRALGRQLDGAFLEETATELDGNRDRANP